MSVMANALYAATFPGIAGMVAEAVLPPPADPSLTSSGVINAVVCACPGGFPAITDRRTDAGDLPFSPAQRTIMPPPASAKYIPFAGIFPASYIPPPYDGSEIP